MSGFDCWILNLLISIRWKSKSNLGPGHQKDDFKRKAGCLLWCPSSCVKCKHSLCIFLACAAVPWPRCRLTVFINSLTAQTAAEESPERTICVLLHNVLFCLLGESEVFFPKEAAAGTSHDHHLAGFMWGHRSTLSSGGLDLTGRLGVKVLPDGVVVYGCSHGHKQVPNGVSEGDDAVAFEEDNPQRVAGSAEQQLAQPRLFRLAERGDVISVFLMRNR